MAKFYIQNAIWEQTQPRVLAQTTLSPDGALEELMAGNKRFRAERLTSFEHDLARLKQHTIEKQEPFAAVLSCADSRVPVELVFDQSIGHIFVVRVAGADLSIRAKLPGFHDMPDELAEGTALEYAARYPGDDARHGGRLANRKTLALLRERGATL